MSNSKSTIDRPEQIEKFAAVFKALSNPHRLRILLEMSRCATGTGCMSGSVQEMKNCQREFAKDLGLAPSTVSHHFKELRQAGLLNMRREGKILSVWVDTGMLAAVKALF